MPLFMRGEFDKILLRTIEEMFPGEDAEELLVWFKMYADSFLREILRVNGFTGKARHPRSRSEAKVKVKNLEETLARGIVFLAREFGVTVDEIAEMRIPAYLEVVRILGEQGGYGLTEEEEEKRERELRRVLENKRRWENDPNREVSNLYV
jgi:hypothetical protein